MTRMRLETDMAGVLPAEGFVNLRKVLEVIPVGETTWRRGLAAGIYPQPVRLGSRTVVWRVEEIRALIDQINSGNPPYLKK